MISRLFKEIYRGMEAFMKISIFYETFRDIEAFQYIFKGKEGHLLGFFMYLHCRGGFLNPVRA
jgi:hypothetical protein